MLRALSIFSITVLAIVATAARAQDDPLADCEALFDGVGVPTYNGGEAMDEGDFTILCRTEYVLSHNTARRVPDWVFERLTLEDFEGTAKRKENFKEDAALAFGSRSELTDYAGSGFDRGHMAPAADMKSSQDAMDESFLLSNMAPQIGIGFNRHIWAHLEDRVRVWTERREDLVVITGPIYGGTKTIGASKVAVPVQFYKIVYEPARNRAIALVLPNKKIGGNDLEPFVTSIDAVEEVTGLNFLPDVPKARQRRAEKNIPTLWEQ